jgi:hypothetical protein
MMLHFQAAVRRQHSPSEQGSFGTCSLPKELRKKTLLLAIPSRLFAPLLRGTVPWERYPPGQLPSSVPVIGVSLSLLGDPPRRAASTRFGLALPAVVGFSIFSASVTGQLAPPPPLSASWTDQGPLGSPNRPPRKMLTLRGRWALQLPSPPSPVTNTRPTGARGSEQDMSDVSLSVPES